MKENIIYILYKGEKLLMTIGSLERALAWKKGTENSTLYKAVLTEIENTK